MAYPKLTVNKDKLTHNVRTMKKLLSDNNIDTLAGVTKVFCGNPEIAQYYVEGGVDFLADSRVENLKKLADFDTPKMLLRIPMISELQDVLDYADISLHSEVKTLKALNELAKKENKVHKVMIMVDLGDLREGFFEEEDFYNSMEEILKLSNIDVYGLGVNLTCYAAVIPKVEILDRLNIYREEVKKRFNHDIKLISGGNSSSVYLVGKEDLKGINNLRLGEALVLGTESAYGQDIENMYHDAWTLHAEIVELKEKPSVPSEDKELGRDAFGRIPVFEDYGIRKRAIVGIGKQDVDLESIFPLDDKLKLLGSSSDHMIIDVTDSETDYEVGDIIKFGMVYTGILKLATSEYVTKEVEE